MPIRKATRKTGGKGGENLAAQGILVFFCTEFVQHRQTLHCVSYMDAHSTKCWLGRLTRRAIHLTILHKD